MFSSINKAIFSYLLALTLIFTLIPRSVFASGALGVTTLDIVPVSGQTGTKVTLSGKNAPGSPLSVWISPQSQPGNQFQLTATVQPKSDGTWEVQVYVPREWSTFQVVPGKYTFTIQNKDKSYLAQGTFSVLGEQNAPNASASSSVSNNIISQIVKQNYFLPLVIVLVVIGGLAALVNKVNKTS